ncbi:MAG: DNA-3-methyladenine glycosylase [Candidatus Bathyarchaeota archaeon]|nr:DNA-3-methyladenine glycosylase [Candidatus Bathyarchaeota archaeon]
MELLRKSFYERDPGVVAQQLLGNRLIRRLEGKTLEGLIVETEAYYSSKDPASRAYHGMKRYNKSMWDESGNIFIYNVHNYWMFNIVAHESGKVGAVLLRAIEPIKGIDIMKANRRIEDVRLLTSGPGRLSRALKIDKSLNNSSVTSNKNSVFVTKNLMKFEVETSHRIGVRIDLDKELRFYIKGNKFVSS